MMTAGIAAIAKAATFALASWGAPCAFTTQDNDWTRSALEVWGRVNAAKFKLAPVTIPTLVLFDETCTHTLRLAEDSTATDKFTAAGHTFDVSSILHGGQVVIPNSEAFSVGLTSFASPDSGGKMFFVMALPSIWRAKAAAPNADLLATVVFVHEFTHTQSPSLGAQVDALVARGLPADADDDVVQSRFGNRPGFSAAYEKERDLLFRAAAAPTLESARSEATSALGSIERRRRTFFTGADAIYADAEEVFLTMEGVAQWAAYAWLIDSAGGSMSPSEALRFVRRGGKRWSQDEGLALLLVLDRLSPEWPAKLLAKAPTNVIQLLGAAVKRR